MENRSKMYKISVIETNIRNSCNVLITVYIETIVAGCFVHLVMNFGAFIDGESWGRTVGLPVLILLTDDILQYFSLPLHTLFIRSW